MPDSKVEVKACHCAYESDCHGIEMIKSPSGKEWAIGGTNTQDRWKFCPWCGGSLSRSPIANNGVSLEEFRMHVLNVLKKRFPHVGEKSYENIKDAQDEIVAKLQPPRGGGEELAINELAQYLQMKDYEHFEKKGNVLTTFQLAEETIKAGYRKEVSGG